MHIEEHHWHRHHLDRDMTLKVYGHWGQPFIVFPCSRGRYFDYQGMGIVTLLLHSSIVDVSSCSAWTPWWYKQMNYFLGRLYNNV